MTSLTTHQAMALLARQSQITMPEITERYARGDPAIVAALQAILEAAQEGPKNPRGRPPLDGKPMTPAQRARRSRERRRYPQEGYSAKQITVMLAPEAHLALDRLREQEPYSSMSQKEILDRALIALFESVQVTVPDASLVGVSSELGL